MGHNGNNGVLTDPIKPDDVLWCRRTFESLRDGGLWGIPRSGLVFTKRGDLFVLTEEMPYDPAMPITEAELREQQADEFRSVRRHFAAAGITVVREIESDEERGRRAQVP